MPEINVNDFEARKFFFPELTNNSNPDARFNGVLGDFKIPDGNPVTMKSIQNAIKSTARKNVSICVISFLNKDYTMHEVLSQIRGSFKNPKANSSIREIWLIFKDKEILRIPRGVAMNEQFYKLVKTL